MQNKVTSRAVLILAGLIVAAGLGLRMASFGWNTYLKGDVNLMALTAREYVQHGRLYYPMIYGPQAARVWATLDPLGMPATQHPPLFPFLAGVMGKLAGTDDTFTLLKVLDEVGGLMLIAALLWAALRASESERQPWLIAAGMAAVSPILVDYSANGSPYIFSALTVALAILMLKHFRTEGLRDYVLAGLLCGVGLQFHNVLVGLPLAFIVYWIINRKSVRWAGVGLFVVVIGVTLIPWIAWNMATLGTPMYSSTTDYAMKELGLKNTSQIVQPATLLRYVRLLFGTLKGFVKNGALELGPFVLILAAAGGWYAVRRDQRTALMIGLPLAAYVIVTLLWPSFKFRFLVPLMSPLLILAGYGFVKLRELFPKQDKIAQVAGWLMLAGSVAWFGAGYFNQPPTRYNAPADEAKSRRLYPAMESLALQLGKQQPGMVMGLASQLDGGIETVYLTRLPYVDPNGVKDQEAVKATAQKYSVRYIWADTERETLVTMLFPTAKPILREDPFVVYEIPPGG